MTYVPSANFTVTATGYTPSPDFSLSDTGGPQPTTQTLRSSTRITSLSAAATIDNGLVSSYDESAHVDSRFTATVNSAALAGQDRRSALSYRGTQSIDDRSAVAFAFIAQHFDMRNKSGWRGLLGYDDKIQSSYSDMLPLQFGSRMAWLTAVALDDTHDTQWSETVGNDRDTRSAWIDGITQDAGKQLPWGAGEPAIKPRDRYVYYPPVYIPPPPNVTPGKFILVDQFNAYVDGTGQQIPLADCSLSLDADSWAWQLRANVIGKAALDLIKPGAGGVVDLHIEINFHHWRFIVESYTRNREFGKQAYTITGRSRTAYLAAPYAPESDYEQPMLYSAQQLIDNHLQYTGFTANYSTIDWLIDAGVFSYARKSPMLAIGQVAAAPGAIIIPAPADDVINIAPRYAASTWDWNGQTGLPEITEDMIRSLSMKYRAGQNYNGVYVTGRNVGVNVRVKRTGTAGDLLHETIIEPLNTTVAVATERGRNILSAAGNKGEYTIELPLLQVGYNPGLFKIGDLLQINEDDEVWPGMVTAVTVDAKLKNRALIITQTLNIERHLS